MHRESSSANGATRPRCARGSVRGLFHHAIAGSLLGAHVKCVAWAGHGHRCFGAGLLLVLHKTNRTPTSWLGLSRVSAMVV